MEAHTQSYITYVSLENIRRLSFLKENEKDRKSDELRWAIRKQQ